MDNGTKKGIMLGILLLGCGVTSLLGNLVGNNKVNLLSNDRQILTKTNKQYVNNFGSRNDVKEVKTMKIYVSGAVQQPGIYDIPFGSRADYAIKIAGGMLDSADTQRINLALKLKDGMQVNVPFAKSNNNKREYAYHSEADYKSFSNKMNNGRDMVLEGSVNLNTASARELETLPGIGPSIAQKIIDYRQHKHFTSVEDLLKVPGIGRSKLAKLKGRICV